MSDMRNVVQALSEALTPEPEPWMVFLGAVRFFSWLSTAICLPVIAVCLLTIIYKM